MISLLALIIGLIPLFIVILKNKPEFGNGAIYGVCTLALVQNITGPKYQIEQLSQLDGRSIFSIVIVSLIILCYVITCFKKK